MDADLLRIPVGPGSMHVERYGHGGSPILLVHGFGTCAFLWREVGPELSGIIDAAVPQICEDPRALMGVKRGSYSRSFPSHSVGTAELNLGL